MRIRIDAVDLPGLECRPGAADAKGGPLCARVVPPHITWTAG